MKNLSIHDVKVGDREVWTRTMTDADVVMYGGLVGDRGPLHLDEEFAAGTHFGARVVYGMQCGGYIGATLAQLLGIGSAYVSQSLRFKGPVLIGDRITVETEVTSINVERKRVFVSTTVRKNGDAVVVEGEAELVMFDVVWTP